jgi:hypothetical protein
MATLKELIAAKAAAGKPAPPTADPARPAETGDAPPPRASPLPPPESHALPPRPDYLSRQDGTEPLPESWPVDESDFATGKDLIVVQNPHLESFLAIQLPSGKVKYLIGPFKTLNIPF